MYPKILYVERISTGSQLRATEANESQAWLLHKHPVLHCAAQRNAVD